MDSNARMRQCRRGILDHVLDLRAAVARIGNLVPHADLEADELGTIWDAQEKILAQVDRIKSIKRLEL